MNLKELLEKLEDTRSVVGMEPEEMEIVIEDIPGIEYIIQNIYFFSPCGIGIDIERRWDK